MRKSLLLFNCNPCPEAMQDLRETCLRTMNAQQLDQGIQDILLQAMQAITCYIIDQANPSPTQLWVQLTKEDDHWLLEIRDDGGSLSNPFAPCIEGKTAIIQDLACQFTDASYIPGDTQTWNRFRMCYPDLPKKPHVTLVDDDSSLRCLIKLYLQDSYRVRDYPDAASALAALDNEPVDLVISDLHMPHMDGLTFRRHLAKKPHTDILPFIFITSSDDDTLLLQAENLGIDDCLTKPVRKRELLTAIRRILRRNRHIQERLSDLLDQAVELALRPALPLRLNQFHCALRTRFANTGGGDLLTYISDEEGTTLILADVLGQGPQAKFFAYTYAGYLGGLLRTLPTGASPADILNRLSTNIRADPVMQSAVVNCLVMRLYNEGYIRLAGAGQPLPILIDTTGICYVEACGVPPGLPAFGEYVETTLQIQSKQRLMLYSDGLLAVDDQPARERFRQAITESSALPLAKAADHIVSIADALGHDDATLILLENSPECHPSGL